MIEEYQDRILAFSYRNDPQRIVTAHIFLNEQEMYQVGEGVSGEEEYVLPTEALLDHRIRYPQEPKPVWRQNTRSDRIPTEAAVRVGSQLWETMSPVLGGLIGSFSTDDSRPLRIKVCSGAQPLLDLPWEWMAMDGSPVVLRDGVRLARSVPTRYSQPTPGVLLPIRVLVVITSPDDELSVDIGRELGVLMSGLRLPYYDVQVLEEPTYEAFASELQLRPPSIVHYIGHAGVSEGRGNLLMRAGGSSRWIDQMTLSRILPSSVRLLCLSTCFTQRNYQIGGFEKIALGPAVVPLPTTIVNRYPVEQLSVETFWSVFYHELVAESGEVVEAMQKAQRAVFASVPGHADWSSFALVIRDNRGRSFRLMGASEDPLRASAQQIQTQFKTNMLNEIAEQMKALSSDSPGAARRSLSSVLDRVAMLRTEE